MRHAWVFVLSGMLVVAGCVDTGGEEKETETSETPSATATSTSTSPTIASATENATNEAPSATMEVDNVTGALPLNVTFTLNGTDPEGEPLSWTLVYGDGSENLTGTELPAVINYTYSTVGNFTAMLEVSDGVNVDNITVAINVTAAAEGGAGQTHVIAGSSLIPFPPGDVLACINDDIDGNIHDLDPAGPGWSYTLEPSDGSFGIYWYSGGSYESTGDPTGVVPDDMDQVEICNLSAIPMSDYTLTLTSP